MATDRRATKIRDQIATAIDQGCGEDAKAAVFSYFHEFADEIVKAQIETVRAYCATDEDLSIGLGMALARHGAVLRDNWIGQLEPSISEE